MLGVSAIDLALNRSRSSLSKQHLVLPRDMTDLVRIAADHRETVERYAAEKKLPDAQLIDAARLYLQNLILESGNDAHKTLALSRGATEAEIKDHKRMLLKWLHPDLNKNRWQSSLFNRVQLAAERLQSAEPEALDSARSKASVPTVPVRNRKQKIKQQKISIGIQRNTRRRALLMRSIGRPVMAIAAGGLMIYLLHSQSYSGSFLYSIAGYLQFWK